MNLNKIITQLLITMTVLASLVGGYAALSQHPVKFLAQTFPGQYKPTDKDKMNFIIELANNADSLFNSYSNSYAKELSNYIKSNALTASLSNARQYKSSLAWYRINTGPWTWSYNGPIKPSDVNCLFSHLSVELIIDCYLNSRGVYDLQATPFVDRLKVANAAQYKAILPYKTKIYNWSNWVKNTWEPQIVRQIR